MPKTLFLETAQRTITSADCNAFVSGVLHPDRVLDEHDLIYICSGEWEVWQEGVPYCAKEGDVLILTAGAHHYGKCPCMDGTKTMYVHVTCSDDLWCEGDLDATDRELDGRISLAPVTHCLGYPRVRQSFETLVAAYARNSFYQNTRLSALFQILLIDLYEAQQNVSTAQVDEFVNQILDLFRDNPQRFYTGSELAKRFFVSPKTLIGRFRRCQGVTPYQYQMNQKLNSIAAFLVDHPQVKLGAVAENFGFYDEFHLSKSFKRKFGCSPSEYRKKQ